MIVEFDTEFSFQFTLLRRIRHIYMFAPIAVIWNFTRRRVLICKKSKKDSERLKDKRLLEMLLEIKIYTPEVEIL